MNAAWSPMRAITSNPSTPDQKASARSRSDTLRCTWPMSTRGSIASLMLPSVPSYASPAPGNTRRVSEVATGCGGCGGALPDGARFCPACGRPASGDVREEPIDLHVAEPHYFGLGPPVFVFSIALALLVLGIVLIV